MNTRFDELLDLPAQERLELAQRLWDSLGPNADQTAPFLAIPEWQIRVLEERNFDLAQNPGAEQDWEDVEAEFRPHR